jgi:hypothetical protein
MSKDLLDKITWPDGKDFAFAVFDDTDSATLQNVREIYSLLTNCGFRTTKSVWPIRGEREPKLGGSTCEDRDYLEWIIGLQKAGFEIGFHNATFHSSFRDETILGIERFAELIGHYPKAMANHTGCQEGIYWGNYKLTGLNRHIYNLLTRYHNNGFYRGHIGGDQYFWGDICKDKIKYVRSFISTDINTLKYFPFMPFHDSKKPYVNYWFASSEGSNISYFNECLSEENQDRLEEEGGACIMYTHFANGFFESGKIEPRFKHLMERLSKKNGWFVPVSTLLDYLLEKRGHHDLTDKERNRIERKWLLYKIRVGRN